MIWREVVRRFAPWVVAALCVLAYGCEQRRAGALAERLGTLTTERNALAARAAVVRREYVRDTVRVTKTVTRYEQVRDSLFLTDTLLRTDTAFVRVTASADTAIRACTESVRSCAVALSLADSIHAVDRRTIRALERARPGVLRRWGDRLLWAGAGYAAGSLIRR